MIEQTPFLCMHFDKTSEKVFILADSQSLLKLGEVEIENILKRTFEESKKLKMFDHRFEDGSLGISSLGRMICQGALRTWPLQM